VTAQIPVGSIALFSLAYYCATALQGALNN